MVRKYSREWQAHLHQIADFFVEGEGVWWSRDEEAIEFHDTTNHPTPLEAGPQLHHFRSSSLDGEAAQLKLHWNQCIDNFVIPIYILRLDQPDGTTKVIRTTFLGDQQEVTSRTTYLAALQYSANNSSEPDLTEEEHEVERVLNHEQLEQGITERCRL